MILGRLHSLSNELGVPSPPPPPGAHVAVPQLHMVPYNATNSAGAAASLCRDMHESCGYWSAHGECEANGRYMRRSCRESCGLCTSSSSSSSGKRRQAPTVTSLASNHSAPNSSQANHSTSTLLQRPPYYAPGVVPGETAEEIARRTRGNNDNGGRSDASARYISQMPPTFRIPDDADERDPSDNRWAHRADVGFPPSEGDAHLLRSSHFAYQGHTFNGRRALTEGCARHPSRHTPCAALLPVRLSPTATRAFRA